MLCNKHPNALTAASDVMVRACSECGNMTYSDCQICAHCSKGFDECQRCRAPMGSHVDPRKIVAFRSPRAQEIRRSKLLARETFATRNRDAETTFAVCTAEYRNLLQEQIAPLRAACEKACRPHRDKLRAVSESLSAEGVDAGLLAIQSTIIPPRLKEAIEQCDAACLSVQDDYERKIMVFIKGYRAAINPSQSELKWTVNRARDQLNMQIRSLDHQLEALLYRSTRFRYIAIRATGEFFRRIFRRNHKLA